MASALEMIVYACLVASPMECRDHRVRLTIQGGDPQLCVYYSVREIALWQQLHPAWRVKTWKCAFSTEDEVI
jgi:hypothetical protein